jgi:effector-binding domain-containing protein
MHTALVDDRTFAAQPTAVRRAVLRPDEVADWISVTLRDIAESLRRRRIVPTGFPYSRRHPTEDGLVVVEAGFPVALPIGTDGTLHTSELPAGPAAVTTHTGPYDKIGGSYDLIAGWLRQHAARSAGDPWEIYHSPPIGCPDGWHTEIVQPFEPD